MSLVISVCLKILAYNSCIAFLSSMLYYIFVWEIKSARHEIVVLQNNYFKEQMISFQTRASLEHYVRFQVAYFSTKYKLIKPVFNVHFGP